MSQRITVMLVDDHAVVRTGYRMLLGQSARIDVLCEAENGEAACQLYQEWQPQVVVMDLNLPGIGGLAAARRIIGRDPSARILIFSMYDEPVYAARALEAGAKGYITKSSTPAMLVDAVLRVARNETLVEPEIAQRLVTRRFSKEESSAFALDVLSAREFDVFCLLARGYSTRQAADELKLSFKTVSNYASLIKDKLNAQTNADLVLIAIQHGLIQY
ncbi:response regulator transcription factor [Methyloparacoccus murrellii]